MVTPLEDFRKKHIGGVKNGKKKFDKQTAKFCQSQERYLNLTTKKQNSVLQEVSEMRFSFVYSRRRQTKQKNNKTLQKDKEAVNLFVLMIHK